MKINKIIFAITCSAMLLSACDEVSEGDRLDYVKPADAKRAVLVEDFTGQRCINCPNATQTIAELQEQYGEENVIAVAIHGGNFGIYEAQNGLATNEAKAYYERWKVEGQPVGLINRKSGLAIFETWTTLVSQQLQLTTPLSIDVLSAGYNSDSTQINVDVELLSAEPMAAKLQLWLLEDSIVARQFLPDGSSTKDYVHNHVFRKSINGTWGTDVTLGESAMTDRFTTDVDPKYNKQNLSVVAFVYTDADGVYQARKTHVGE